MLGYLSTFISPFHFQLGTSSMNSKLTGEGGGGDDGDVQKQALQFLAINSDFWA